MAKVYAEIFLFKFCTYKLVSVPKLKVYRESRSPPCLELIIIKDWVRGAGLDVVRLNEGCQVEMWRRNVVHSGNEESLREEA